MSDNQVTERWAYRGQRLTASGKLLHSWQPLDSDVGPYYFLKVKGGIVGGIYEVSVEHTDAGSLSVFGEAKWTGEWLDDDDDRVAQWRAEAHADGVAHARRTTEKRLASEDEFEEMMRPLIERMRRLKRHDQRAAFVAAVTEALFR